MLANFVAEPAAVPPWGRLSDIDPAVGWGQGARRDSEVSSTRVYPSPITVKVMGDAPVWLKPTVDRLNKLLGLPENWDLEGAGRVSPRAVTAALELLFAAARPDTPPPSIVPTAEGGVQLEWHLRGIDLEVEVDLAGRHQAFLVDSVDDSEWEAELTSNVEPLVMALSLLWRRQ